MGMYFFVCFFDFVLGMVVVFIFFNFETPEPAELRQAAPFV